MKAWEHSDACAIFDDLSVEDCTCKENAAKPQESEGILTKKMLDDAIEAIRKQGNRPRHDCRFDGHALQWNPFGFHFCIYCNKSEADLERPDDG